jgi:hypothetical protein
MVDRKQVHVVGHTVSKDGMVQPFHFTLAEERGLVISHHGMRDMEPAELHREDKWWEHKRISDFLDELKNTPAWLHPEFVPVDTSGPQVNVAVVPKQDLARHFEESLPSGLPTTRVVLNQWDGIFDMPLARPYSPSSPSFNPSFPSLDPDTTWHPTSRCG